MGKSTKYVWCLHCERVSLREEWEKMPYGECPYKDCDGHRHDVNGWSKNDWPRRKHPEYPRVPELGKEYPLY